MKKMIFPVITEFETKLPYYLVGVGCSYNQEPIMRPDGFPYYQWIQCRSGSGRLILNDSSYTVAENQGMLLFPNEAHEYYALSHSWEVDWIIFLGTFMEHFFINTTRLNQSGVYYILQPQTIASKIAKIYEIEQSASSVKSIESSRITYDILMDILQFTSIKNDGSMMHQYNRLKPLLDYIDMNFSKDSSLQQFADIVKVTPQHLCSLFKKMTTHTLSEYINLIRIKNAKEYIIQNKEIQIKEVSRLVGFSDVSYFCQIFRKVEKMSPLEFKKLHQL